MKNGANNMIAIHQHKHMITLIRTESPNYTKGV